MRTKSAPRLTWIDDGDSIEIYVDEWFLTSIYKHNISKEAMEVITGCKQ